MAKAYRTRIPTTRALMAFEASARLGSFQLAAEELGATPSAVSHQIATIEGLLGHKLFQRFRNRVELTEEGRIYLRDVSQALAQIGSATRRFMINAGERPLRIATHPLIALYWFMPRAADFRRRFPEVSLDLVTSDRPIALFTNEVDLAIDHGDLEAAARNGHDIVVRRTATPIFTREFQDTLQALDSPSDLLRIPRLANLARPTEWDEWLDAAGVDRSEAQESASFRFANRALVIAAMRRSIGAAIGCRNLLSADLENGSLIAPFDLSLTEGDGYYLLASRALKDVDFYYAFRSWLIENSKP